MQWLLQDFEDTRKLGDALVRFGIRHSWHRVVPFVGDLDPKPEIADPNDVILFGSYTLGRYAKAKNLTPGVFVLRPFLRETAWHPFLLNGADAIVLTLKEVQQHLPEDARAWFVRPVSDSKEIAGTVKTGAEIAALAARVCALAPDEIPRGSLRHDTELMLTEPVRILKEWRVWVVADTVVTHSVYKEGARVIYRAEIDDDADRFVQELVAANPNYAPAYVIDICRTPAGLKMLETNCINAAGFYAADMQKLVHAVENIPR
ncbi:MAG: ATP-grasp domain-containing protein [Pseudomonadota bacterium]